MPADRREALLAVASHCTVHNTLTTQPHVNIAFADADATLDHGATVSAPAD